MSFNTNKLANKARIYVNNHDNTNQNSGAKFTLDFPEEVNKNKFKLSFDPEDNYFDVIPYRITSDKHPLVKQGKVNIAKDDEYDFQLEFQEHTNIGNGKVKSSILCTEGTYGEGHTCKLCEERRRQLKAGKQWNDLDPSLKPKKRVIYNIVDLRNRADGIKVFVTNVPFVGNGIYSAAKVSKDDPIMTTNITGPTFEVPMEDTEKGESVMQYIMFFSPDEGKTVHIKCDKAKFSTTQNGAPKSFEYAKPINFTLENRPKQYDNSIVDQAYDLSSFLNIPSEKEIVELYWGKAAAEETVDPAVEPVVEEPKNEPSKEIQELEKHANDPMHDSSEPECPFNMEFGIDFDTDPKVCDQCMMEHKDVYKACAKKSSQLENL